jgi:cation:H+ antiporter
MFWTILFLAFGFVLLIKSANFLIDGTAGLAKHFHIPKIIIGLTLVAFGTSAPEGTVSIIAALQNNDDLSVANIIGSNITNIGLILGLAAILRTLPVTRSTITASLPLNILTVFIFIILGYDHFFQNQSVIFNRFTLGDGLIFLSFFIIFLYYIYADLKVAKEKEKEIEKRERTQFKHTPLYLSLLSLGGLAGLLVGGKLVVDNAVVLAKFFHLSEAFIGLTIVAIGTSLPEIMTSLTAVMKRETDIAIGNIVGSNIFNILLVLGITSVIAPLDFDPKLLFDAIFMLFITIILFLIVLKQKSIPRWGGIILLCLYVLYLILMGYKETALAYFF